MTVRAFEGHAPRIPASAYMDAQALVVGDAEFGADSSVWPMDRAAGVGRHYQLQCPQGIAGRAQSAASAAPAP